MKSINPATQTLIREYEDHTDEDVSAALSLAQSASLQWKNVGFEYRSELFERAAMVLRERSEDWAILMTREMGKPITEARSEVEKCAWVCEHYAAEAQTLLKNQGIKTDASESWVQFEPLGTVLAVMPWNFPFWQVFRFAAPTLMAGNTALLKHAANVSGCALAIEEIFASAGFPEGVFQTLLIDHDQTERVLRDKRVHAVSLTGSTRAGKAIAKIAGEVLKPALLELGGSDPFIVLADANLEEAAEQAALARCLNSGQSCIAAKRFIVQDDVHDEFVHLFRRAMREKTLGNPEDEDTKIGPQARVDLLEELHSQVERSVEMGAQRLAGGHLSDLGPAFYPATVLGDVQPGMPVFDEETFGPVAAIIRAKDDADAIRLANLTIYGLGASLWTQREDVHSLVTQLQCGHVAVNGIVKSDPRLPFGGIKESGFGRELGPQGILSFVNLKTVWRK